MLICKAENADLESDVLSLILSHSIQGLSQRAKQLIDYDVSFDLTIDGSEYNWDRDWDWMLILII